MLLRLVTYPLLVLLWVFITHLLISGGLMIGLIQGLPGRDLEPGWLIYVLWLVGLVLTVLTDVALRLLLSGWRQWVALVGIMGLATALLVMTEGLPTPL
jgi:hypothetical protein